MKNINRKDIENKYRKEWRATFWKKYLAEFEDSNFRDLINSLFSEYEKSLIVNRLIAASLIQRGVATKEIEKLLWLSRATISAIKRNLIKKSPSYGSPRSFRGRATKKEWSNFSLKQPVGFLNGVDLLEILKNPPRPSSLGVIKKSNV